MSVFRSTYRALSPEEVVHVLEIKDHAEGLLAAMLGTKTMTHSRELSLARTKLEESVMWAVKAVTG